ncbi:MAG TPA: hypothetical protein VLA56_02465, partial [Pseudomonadales bacterium]|nr:hypothetical protein [Pseudomonadales bacterium]
MNRFALPCLALVLAITVGACAEEAPPTGGDRRADAPVTPAIDGERLSEIVRVLASDEFEGRAPGGPGEAKTIAFLIDQFRSLGLEPDGEDGGWTQ